MFSRIRLLLVVATFSISGHAQSEPGHDRPIIVPLHRMPAGQWIEKVWGDPSKAGEPFAIRIHNDAGYIVLPHVHPMDENVVVVKGVWWFGMGGRFNPSSLESVELGAFAFGPKNMPHFAWSKTETITHIYGIGPFATKLIDPVYELTSEGTFLLTSLLEPGTLTSFTPPDCFPWRVGARVQGAAGEGTVAGARCSPVNQIRQYWIQKPDGDRFWARVEELKPI